MVEGKGGHLPQPADDETKDLELSGTICSSNAALLAKVSITSISPLYHVLFLNKIQLKAMPPGNINVETFS